MDMYIWKRISMCLLCSTLCLSFCSCKKNNNEVSEYITETTTEFNKQNTENVTEKLVTTEEETTEITTEEFVTTEEETTEITTTDEVDTTDYDKVEQISYSDNGDVLTYSYGNIEYSIRNISSVDPDDWFDSDFIYALNNYSYTNNIIVESVVFTSEDSEDSHKYYCNLTTASNETKSITVFQTDNPYLRYSIVDTYNAEDFSDGTDEMTGF